MYLAVERLRIGRGFGRACALIPVVCVAAASSAAASGDPGSTSQDPLHVSADIRFFGGDEELTYFNVMARYQLQKLGAVEFLGTFADRKDTIIDNGDTYRHGGSDLEFRVSQDGKFQNGEYSGFVGVAIPNTPAQSKSVNLTLGGKAEFHVASETSLFVEPMGVGINNNTLVGIGLGASQRLERGFSVKGEIIPLIAGDNAHATSDGHLERDMLYNVGFNYMADKSWWVGAGFTNQLGVTTGMSLTPSLGDTGGFYVRIGGRF